jgi:N,N-dimethylformamidase
LGKTGPLPGQIVADWNPEINPGTTTIVDTGRGQLHGTTVNLPTRAMTGPFWSAGATTTARQHDAIHFHTDDVGDLRWEPTLRLELPAGIRSGFHAIRLSAGGQRMHIPLYVRSSSPTAPVVFLVPTNTYLAYANHRMFLGNDALNALIASHPIEPNDRDVLVLEYPFLGRSPYDLHDDGGGVHMVSWNRPIVSFEPTARDFLAAGPRNITADLDIVGWLERSGVEYEILTDEDLHAEGDGALEPHQVVVTGSHPEYWTRPMMEGLQDYLMTGGKLMYLGGNGFYWMTSLSSDRSIMEVRRGSQATRACDSSPGELVHATSGDLGGMWRSLGVSPQSLVGVGMSAQGWGGGRGYERLPDSFDARVDGFFAGIDPGETIGNFGHVMHGAAGDEVDRLDHTLGTPSHALRLATSLMLPDQYQLVVEEVRNMTPTYGGTQCDMVRSDIVWFDLPGGGEVFSVGSVSWAAAMGWNHGDNNVARLTSNVLGGFLARGPQDRGGGSDRAKVEAVQREQPPGDDTDARSR